MRWLSEHPVLVAFLAGVGLVAAATIMGKRYSWLTAIFLALLWGILSALPWLVRRSRRGSNNA